MCVCVCVRVHACVRVCVSIYSSMSSCSSMVSLDLSTLVCLRKTLRSAWGVETAQRSGKLWPGL